MLPEHCADRLDEALLLVSELVTNAILHARSAVQLTMIVLDGAVRFEVRDTGAALPAVRPPSETSLNGRGLSLLDAVADRWGVEQRTPRRGPGKVVWFELDLPNVAVAPPGRRRSA